MHAAYASRRERDNDLWGVEGTGWRAADSSRGQNARAEGADGQADGARTTVVYVVARAVRRGYFMTTILRNE